MESEQKKKMIIYPHFGLGDLLNLSGAIRYFSKKYVVTVVILNSNLNNASQMFDDINDIKFYGIEKETYYPENKEYYDYINTKYDEVKLVGKHIKLDYDLSNTPLSYYKDLNLDPSISTTDFIKKSIINKESYRLKGVDYIFMSLKAGNFRHTFNPNSNKLIICPEENLNHPKNPLHAIGNLFINLNYLEYVDIIEGANEIYVLDDLYYDLASRCNLSTPPGSCVCFCRSDNNLDKRFKKQLIKTPAGFATDTPFVNGINRNTLLQRMGKR